MSGKTYFLMNLIKNRDLMISPRIQRVIYSYKKYQSIFDTVPDVEFVQGMNFTLDKNIPTLLVIDDQMNDRNDKIAELFTVNCHHDNTSIIFVTQNLFLQNKDYRTAALNTQYFILFRSPRGTTQVQHLARQMFVGGRAKEMVKAYENATSQPFTYLVVDMKPDTPHSMRLKCNMLPDEGEPFEGVHLAHCYTV
jgi:hypothetical protein